MAIYEVLIRQSYFAQECINRMHYVNTTPLGAPTAASLAEAFGANSLSSGYFDADSVMGKIQAMQTDAASFLEVQVRNLYSATDFFTVAYNPPPFGTDANGDGMSPAVAYGFVSNRVTLAVRRGHKRFVGVAEGNVAAGGLIAGAFYATLTDVADALSASLNQVDGVTTSVAVPAVLAYQSYVTPSGKTAYKPYDDEATQLAHAAVGVTYTFMPAVRTQRSRQYGRGS